MYQRLIIFYFTGTGNALAAAHWIAEISEQQNIPADIIKITPSLLVERSELDRNTLIGFCYPTHGFNAPPVVINFISGFPKSKNPVFLLNTRAGMKLSKLFTPGMSGLAQLLPALILKLKGYKIVGLQPMDLPSNWISIHPGLREKVIDSIFYRCERISKNFALKILEGKNVYKGLISLPVDLLISPISLGYYIFGRFMLAKTFVAGNCCNKCRICEKECPVHAIQMKNERPYWTFKCESCMHCMNRCPQKTIQTPHLFVVFIWWLIFSVIPLWLMGFFIQKYPEIKEYYEIISNILIISSGFLLVFFSYRILHFAMKFRFFNWLITYTSLTGFRFWRRYFAPKKFLKSNTQ